MEDLSDKAQALIKYWKQGQQGFCRGFCPQPTYWNHLYDMLPDKKRDPSSGGWIPALPLNTKSPGAIGLLKIMILHEHIVWADKHGVIDEVDTYLRNLSEEQWFHGND